MGKKSSDPPEPPEPPKLEMYQPQIDFFTNQTIQKSVLGETGYELASELVFTKMAPFVQNIHSYLLFLEPAHQSEPEFNEGIWEWQYTHTRETESFNVRLTAEENNEGDLNYMWMLYISSSSNQDQQSLNNYKLMEFNTNPDPAYNDGSFFIYPIEYQDPDISFILDWSLQDERYHELHFGFSNLLHSTEGINVLYTKDVAVHVVEMDYASGEHFIIYWNADTNEGFVYQTQDSQSTDLMICWDENLNDTEC